MQEKKCSNCRKAGRLAEPPIIKISVTQISENGSVVNEIYSRECAPKQEILTRGCNKGNGTQTSSDYDKCISKLEFEKIN